MGNVLEFPSQQAQGLAFLDRQVRQLLTAKQRCASPSTGVNEALCTYLFSEGVVLDRDTLYALSLKVQSKSNTGVRKTRKY